MEFAFLEWGGKEGRPARICSTGRVELEDKNTEARKGSNHRAHDTTEEGCGVDDQMKFGTNGEKSARNGAL